MPLQKNSCRDDHLEVSYSTVNGIAAEAGDHHPRSLDSAVAASYCKFYQATNKGTDRSFTYRLNPKTACSSNSKSDTTDELVFI